MWLPGVMIKSVTIINLKGSICFCVWCQIQHHPHEKIIRVGTFSLSLRTIVIFTKRCLNIGGCWQITTMIHPCGFQYFEDKSSLIKLKSTTILCIVFDAWELIHWLSLWVFSITTGKIPIERLHYFINIVLWIFPKQTIIHIYHTYQSLVHEQHGSIFLTTQFQSNKSFHNFSYHRHAASYQPYRILFNLITTSHCPTSLLKYMGVQLKMASHLEYLHEKIYLCSQYFEYIC